MQKVLICSTIMEVQDTSYFRWSVCSSDVYILYGTWASTLDCFTCVFCSIILLKNSYSLEPCLTYHLKPNQCYYVSLDYCCHLVMAHCV